MKNYVIEFIELDFEKKEIAQYQLSVIAGDEAKAINIYVDIIGYRSVFKFLEVNQID